MHTGTHANTGSIARLEKPLRDFTAMLEVEIAGDHIDLPSFPDVALRVRRALACADNVQTPLCLTVAACRAAVFDLRSTLC